MRTSLLLLLTTPLMLASASVSALQFSERDAPASGWAAHPSITADGKDGFVLNWQQKSAEGASLHFAHLDRDGKARSSGQIAASTAEQTWFVNWADFPSLVVLDNGDWVTYWLQKRSKATYAYDIHLVRSSDQGAHWSESLLPHQDGTASEHGFVSLVPAGKDRVLAIWLDGRNTVAAGGDAGAHEHGGSGAMTLRSAVIDRAGRLSEAQEIDSRTCDCCSTDAARLGDSTLLVYRDRGADEIRDINFQVRSKGRWNAEPGKVHDDQWKIAGCPVNGPALASNAGRALVAWTTMQGESLSVRTAVGDTQGFAAMQELEAGDRTLGRVDASAWGKQDFLVSWVGSNAGAGGNAIHLAVIDAGNKIAQRSVLHPLAAGSNPGMPRIARSGDRAIATWAEVSKDSARLRMVLIEADAATDDRQASKP